MHIHLHNLWCIAARGAGYGARYVKLRMDAARVFSARINDPTDELLSLQALYGYNAHSLVSILPGAILLASPSTNQYPER